MHHIPPRLFTSHSTSPLHITFHLASSHHIPPHPIKSPHLTSSNHPTRPSNSANGV
ncbi:hypothetical protein M413DRAFT_448058 [Hebeloma cylindrosporum]|uniref:Uncharacterized protein n=1 Tax=Hebeloma cylindrosporum TaxID=76867 RepID=A0A0C2YAH1_HEBCY|nr:hypothetical protein M413DRAFT_448058 [Hebeloma cylindrosporum h7]